MVHVQFMVDTLFYKHMFRMYYIYYFLTAKIFAQMHPILRYI